MEERDTIINEIVANASECKTTEEKLKYVFNWFVTNCNYDYTVLTEYKVTQKMVELERKFPALNSFYLLNAFKFNSSPTQDDIENFERDKGTLEEFQRSNPQEYAEHLKLWEKN